MNSAVAIPLFAGTVNLTSAVIHVALSRAPGWRVARVTALIALTGALYCLSDVPYGIDGLSQVAYLATARITYVAAVLHALAWLVFVYGGPEASYALVPFRVRVVMVAVLAATVVLGVTGLHLSDQVTVVAVSWSGVRYHYPVATTLGDVYGLVVPALFGLALWGLVARVRAGDRALRPHVLGFAVFFLCSIDEVLVANRAIVFVSLGAVGLVVVVLPLTVALVRRVIADAWRLSELSGRLEDEVRTRTEERDRARSALLEAERQAALGRLAAGVGHEINNPLTYLQLALEEARTAAHGSAGVVLGEALETARDGANRIQRVVEGLRSYSRQQEQHAALDLRDVARTALKVAGPQVRHVAAVELELDAVPSILGDEPRLVQAVVNLLTNAAQAVGGRPDARVVVSTATAASGAAELAVRDSGPGIPPELIRRVSEPFFTTRSGAGGLGLGLFVTTGIVADHKGRLVLESLPGQGTRACIVIPPAPAGTVTPAPPALDAAPSPAPVERRARVLIVDDDPLVLRMLSRALERWWQVTAVTSGEEALALAATEPFDAVVCDLMMPGMSGMEVCDELDKRHPALRRRTLFLTGGAVAQEAQDFLARADVRSLTKPVSPAVLSSTLHELLGLHP
jgi:signal transduction histidine kinase/CheY-like chemotaxis protein